MAEVGTRVIRGPHWQSGDADGGEGHLGTLRALLGNGQVRVLWDNGQEVTCKAGADGKYELRVIDTAPVGVRHHGTVCEGCQEKDIYGMLWRCLEKTCHGATLCPVCYVMDRHNIKHVFERVDREGDAGEKVKKRSVSLKIRTMGIFPGAKVQRGKDWMWADQDGGPGSVGEVQGYENVAPTSSRNLVQVTWDSGVTNSYRLGLQGQVDIQCLEEAAGTYYYKEHLPVVDVTGKRPVAMSTLKPGASSSVSLLSSSSSSSSSSPPSSFQGVAGATGGGGGREGGDVKVGDKVVIAKDEEKLKELQAKYGGTTAGMIQCIGKTGEVVSITANGALQVKFKRLSYRFNPQALRKVPTLAVGDVVRIQPDLDQAKVLNKCVGWKAEMDVTCGKVGKIVKVDEDGDVAVAFGRKVHLYAPSCCQQGAGLKPDTLSSSNENSGNSGNGGDSGDNDQGELHRKLMKMLAQMVQEDAVDSGSHKDSDDSEMAQLFKAIHRGDTEAVRCVCMADKSLMSQVHKGMTLLMVACHEAQRDIINVLLDLGAPIDGQGESGNTALGAALEGKKESIALLLLQRGASVKQLNSKDRNAAHVAAYNNLGEALREIIRRGADVNHKDKYGDSPLHDAIEKDNKEAIDALMEASTLNLQLRNKKGFNMLQLACLRGNVHAVERIVRRDRRNLDDKMNGEFNALQIAVTNDHVECARILIAEGKAAIDIKGSQGLTALHLSCNEAYPRCVELLINYGADLNIKAEDGNTPLHLAIGTKSTQLRKNPSDALEKHEHRNRVRIACMLLEKGAFIDSTNNNGAEPLQCCRPEAIRKGVQRYVAENPQLIRKKGGGRTASLSTDEMQAAMSALLRGTSDATKQQLQQQCKQS